MVDSCSWLSPVFSDTPTQTLEGLFGIGQVVKVRITEVKPDGTLLVASILQATSEFVSPTTEINKIQIGSTVSGTVTDIHRDNVVLKLIPTQATALLSLNNLANFRTTSVSQLRASLKTGAVFEDLVVVSKNSSKSLVIVATQPKKRTKLPAQDSSLRMENLKVGQSYLGMVVKQSRKGATVRLAKHVFGTLHPTDVSDDYSTSNSFPAVESMINVMVIDLDVSSHQVVLSTRPSRVNGEAGAKTGLADPEVADIQSLKIGQTVRGFVKSVADSGVFVALSRALDARVQIKELFDEVSVI
jgi:rRNA biogenesis protein RRP5